MTHFVMVQFQRGAWEKPFEEWINVDDIASFTRREAHLEITMHNNKVITAVNADSVLSQIGEDGHLLLAIREDLARILKQMTGNSQKTGAKRKKKIGIEKQ